MFKCFFTGKCSQAGEKPHRIVLETRPKTYMGWVYNEEDEQWEKQEVGVGYETVKEVLASDEGLKIWINSQKK